METEILLNISNVSPIFNQPVDAKLWVYLYQQMYMARHNFKVLKLLPAARRQFGVLILLAEYLRRLKVLYAGI